MIIDSTPERKYKNLVFDVGEVLLGYRPMEMMVEDHKMSPETAKRYLTEVFSNSLWDEFDLENIPFEDVVAQYCELFPQWESDIRWMMSHTELMAVPRPKVWKKVAELRQAGYKIYLLSNYSSHLLALHTRGASFPNDIDGAVVSYMIHKMKPDPEIYETLFERYGLIPQECLFFDDRPANVVASDDLGMDAVLVKGEDMLLGFLDKL